MPTNPYFRPYDDIQQQRLYKNLINEFIRFYGIDAYYVPRISLTHVDLLFGDDPTKAFSKAYKLAILIENADSFDAPGDLFTKFGFVINKSVRLLVGNTDFQTATSGDISVRPREGDLVYLVPFQALYEIKIVNQDKLFYAFGRKQFYGWELDCEEFRFNNELINSGVEEIDEQLDTITIAYQAVMNTSGTLTYELGETVYQGANVATANATGIVVSWNKPAGLLVLRNMAGKFLANTLTIGANSNAQYTMISIEIEDNVNDLLDNNLIVRTEANTDLDMTENNSLQGNPITSASEE